MVSCTFGRRDASLLNNIFTWPDAATAEGYPEYDADREGNHMGGGKDDGVCAGGG